MNLVIIIVSLIILIINFGYYIILISVIFILFYALIIDFKWHLIILMIIIIFILMRQANFAFAIDSFLSNITVTNDT